MDTSSSKNKVQKPFRELMARAVPIWQILMMTQNEYRKMHCQPFVIIPAKVAIEIETKDLDNIISKLP